MKKQLLVIGSIFAFTSAVAQINVSSMEDVNLALPDTFYNGSDGMNGFQSGNVFYPTAYDTAWDYWSGGFAASNMKDSVTSGYTNTYSAKPAGGCMNSAIYAVGQNNSVIKMVQPSLGDSVFGFYVTNTTYAYNSMRDGDAFAKKFGGASGNDPDWFLLTVKKYYNGVLSADSVYFYLADFRYSNNANDYILKTWQWVDCSSLGLTDSLVFSLTSSDVGAWGMNTPAFFAIDNVTTKASIVGVKESTGNDFVLNAYPNPAADFITVSGNFYRNRVSVSIYDVAGKKISASVFANANEYRINVSDLKSGVYLVEVEDGDKKTAARFIKL